MIITFLENADVKDKRVLLRLDFDHLFEKNFKRGKSERFGIVEPTLRLLLNGNAKVVIAPSFTIGKNKNKNEYSTEPYARYICDLFKCNVYLTDKVFGSIPQKLSHDMEPGSLLFLENLFSEDEEKNSGKEFAEELSKLGDVYVNEAFSLSGLELASTTSIVDFYNGDDIYAGLNFHREYENANRINSSETLFTLCLSSQDDLLESIIVFEKLVDRIDRVLLMGEVSSLYSVVINEIDNHDYPKNLVNKFRKLMKSAEVRNISIFHVADYYVKEEGTSARLIRNEVINDKNGFFDIGDETGKIFSEVLLESKNTFWIGGLPFNKEYDLLFGSAKIVDTAGKNELYVIGACQDRLEQDNKSQVEDGFFDFQSNCCKTFVDSVTGEKMPVLEKLEAKFR